METYELNVDGAGKVVDPPVLSTNPVKQVEYVYDNGRIGVTRADRELVDDGFFERAA